MYMPGSSTAPYPPLRDSHPSQLEFHESPIPLAEERRRIEELLQDVKERLVDFALKTEDIERFEEWFKAWYNEVLSEIRLWRGIAEKAKSIDFGELIRSIRLSRVVEEFVDKH